MEIASNCSVGIIAVFLGDVCLVVFLGGGCGRSGVQGDVGFLLVGGVREVVVVGVVVVVCVEKNRRIIRLARYIGFY